MWKRTLGALGCPGSTVGRRNTYTLMKRGFWKTCVLWTIKPVTVSSNLFHKWCLYCQLFHGRIPKRVLTMVPTGPRQKEGVWWIFFFFKQKQCFYQNINKKETELGKQPLFFSLTSMLVCQYNPSLHYNSQPRDKCRFRCPVTCCCTPWRHPTQNSHLPDPFNTILWEVLPRVPRTATLVNSHRVLFTWLQLGKLALSFDYKCTFGHVWW